MGVIHYHDVNIKNFVEGELLNSLTAWPVFHYRLSVSRDAGMCAATAQIFRAHRHEVNYHRTAKVRPIENEEKRFYKGSNSWSYTGRA